MSTAPCDRAGGVAAREERGEKRGEKQGERRGEERARALGIFDLCEVLGLMLTDEQRSHVASMSLDELEALRQHLKRERAFPL